MLLATYENTDIGQLFRVNDAEDISFLISESEIMTGSPGRKFVISSADRLVYRIHWHVDGYTMQRLDGNDIPIGSLTIRHPDLRSHSLSEAIRAGQLFTLEVRQ